MCLVKKLDIRCAECHDELVKKRDDIERCPLYAPGGERETQNPLLCPDKEEKWVDENAEDDPKTKKKLCAVCRVNK